MSFAVNYISFPAPLKYKNTERKRWSDRIQGAVSLMCVTNHALM